VPVDGVGLQFHITLEYPGLQTIKETLDLFNTLGIEIHITELDMSINQDPNLKADTAEKEYLIRQAHRYKEIFNLFKQYENITNVTFWGFQDGHTWLTYSPVTKPDWPLIFDKDLNIKPAYWGLVDPAKLPPDVVIENTNNNNFVALAARGTPVIDGTAEAVWSDTEEMDINIFIAGNGSTGTGRALWDEQNLYVFVDVKDDNLSKLSSNSYEHDSVEIFVDELNNKSTDYLDDDAQYRLNFENEFSSRGNPAEYVSAVSITEEGYCVEIMIPFRFIKPEKGIELGFELQINDDSGSGSRTSYSKWNDKTNESFRNTSGFGTLVLGE
jgi:endo-1,4-beta-xylanase